MAGHPWESGQYGSCTRMQWERIGDDAMAGIRNCRVGLGFLWQGVY